MKLLKSKEEYQAIAKYENWTDEPNEYPCFMYTHVESWWNEEELPVFLYLRDLVNMAKELQLIIKQDILEVEKFQHSSVK